MQDTPTWTCTGALLWSPRSTADWLREPPGEHRAGSWRVVSSSFGTFISSRFVSRGGIRLRGVVRGMK